MYFRNREKGRATTDHLSLGGKGTAYLNPALSLPSPPPLATGFQIWERHIHTHLAHSSPWWPTPATCWPQTGSDRRYLSRWHGCLWLAWCEISKCQGPAAEIADQPLMNLPRKEMSALCLAFGCSSPKKIFFSFPNTTLRITCVLTLLA